MAPRARYSGSPARRSPSSTRCILLLNAAVPIVTVIGIGIALLIGGAVVTESVFAIPGLGRLTVDAILRRAPALQKTLDGQAQSAVY